MNYNDTIKDLKKILKKELSKTRYAHVQNVAATCIDLASKFSVPRDTAELVGLSHDLAREWSNKKLKMYATAHGYKPRKMELRKPILLHGRCAALFLQEEYGITNPSIFNALSDHTLGRKEMDMLGILLYVSDYIEPGRKYISAKFRRQIQKLDPWNMVIEVHYHQKKRNKHFASLTRQLDSYAKSKIR